MTASIALSLEPTPYPGSLLKEAPVFMSPKGPPRRFGTLQNFHGPTETDRTRSPSTTTGWTHLGRGALETVLLLSVVNKLERTGALFWALSEESQSLENVYEQRFAELQDLSQSEGIPSLKTKAKDDFLEFLGRMGISVRRASLALLDDGSLGATWRNEKWRLNLRFNGNREIEYVLLDRTNPPEGKTGTRNLEGFKIEGIEISDVLAG